MDDGARLVAVERMMRRVAARQRSWWGLTGPPGGGGAGSGGVGGGGPGTPGGPGPFGWLSGFGGYGADLLLEQLRPGAFDPNGLDPFGFDPWNPPGPWSEVGPPGPAPDTTTGPPGTGTYTVTCRWGTHTGRNMDFPPSSSGNFTVSGKILIGHTDDPMGKHTNIFHDTSEFADIFQIDFIIDPASSPPTCKVQTVSGFMSPAIKDGLTWWVDKNRQANEGTPTTFSNVGVPDVYGVLVSSHATTASWDFSTTDAMGWGFQDGDAIVTITKTS